MAGMSVLERLEARSIPEPNSGCRLWFGATRPNGYGSISVEGKNRGVHTVSFEIAKGPLPPGHEPDHLCRTRTCINADHMEAVTRAVNTRRGAKSALAPPRTHCRNGHDLSVVGQRPNESRGRCAQCARERGRKYMRRRRAALERARAA